MDIQLPPGVLLPKTTEELQQEVAKLREDVKVLTQVKNSMVVVTAALHEILIEAAGLEPSRAFVLDKDRLERMAGRKVELRSDEDGRVFVIVQREDEEVAATGQPDPESSGYPGSSPGQDG